MRLQDHTHDYSVRQVEDMKIRIAVIAFCLLLLFAVIALIDSFSHSYSDEPVPSDLIVMVGGGEASRMEKAGALFKEGYAEKVLITPVVESGRFAQSSALAVENGIPQSALLLDHEATSTYQNAIITMEMMQERGMTSALVVTSDYHIKRTKYIYDKLNDGSFEFRYISSLSEAESRWNESRGAFYIWYSEAIKLWAYRFGLYRWSE